MRAVIAWLRHRDRMIYFEYAVLAGAVLLPMLLPGYILTTDLVFTPKLDWPDELTNDYVLKAVLHVLNLVIPSDLLQKAILFLILLLSGVGMHKLVRMAQLRNELLNDFWRWGAYFAGILYTINPFTYSRFMAGQWQVLLGYALLPFFVRALLTFFAKPDKQSAVWLAVWTTLIAIVSIHHIGMMMLLGLVGLGLVLWRYRDRMLAVLKWGSLSVAMVLVANSYWLVPTLLGTNSVGQSVSSFDQGDASAFASNDSGSLGTLGNVVRLQGFWLEGSKLFALPQDHMPAWGLVALAVWILVGMGVVVGWRIQRFVTLFFAISALLGIVLATTPIMPWLGAHIPLLAGYREPHKFVNLIALGYPYLGALGVLSLLSKLNKRTTESVVNAVLIVSLLLPLALTPTMLWGFGGQLTPRQYPDDWFAINTKLNQDSERFEVLFLPWHQYMEFSFSGRIIANPAANFFDKPVVISDDPEYRDAGPSAPNDKNRRIEAEILNEGQATNQIGHRLTGLDIKYVLLAKEYDYDKYKYLDQQTDLVLETETEHLKLYRNTAFARGAR